MSDAPPPEPDQRPRDPVAVRALWLVAFATILFGIRLAIIGAYGNATPFWDQWNAEAADLYAPLVEGGLDWRILPSPHNVHRILTMRLLAIGLFASNGMWNPLLQMVANSAIWAATLAMVAALLDRATGRRHLPLLLTFALVVFGLPYGNENLLAGFHGCFALIVFWSTLALWALALAPPLGPAWWAGLAAAVLAFLSFGSGAFVAAAAAAIAAAQYAGGTRRDTRQLAAITVLATLFIVGVMLTRGTEEPNSLGAESPTAALIAWTRATGWPLKIGPVGLLIVHWPAIVLAVVMLRRQHRGDDPRWFLLATVACALGHAAAIACGRAASGCLTSRYLDLYAVGLMADFACLLAVFPEFTGVHRRTAVVTAVGWVTVVTGSLAVYTQAHARTEMELRRDTAAAQQAHTRAYVLTGDLRNLEDKPRLHVPHPEIDTLSAILVDPTVRSFLPGVIAPPLAATSFTSEPDGAFVPGGTDPAGPRRDESSWGSHGPAGPDATGEMVLAFGQPHRGYAVDVPVIVGGDVSGLSIEVELDGERRTVTVPAATGDWKGVRVTVHGRPFTLRVSDQTPTGWIAVAAPVAEGRFDHMVARLLARWGRFVAAGVVLALALLVHRVLDREA